MDSGSDRAGKKPVHQDNASRGERLTRRAVAVMNRRSRWMEAFEPLEGRTMMSTVPVPAVPTNLQVQSVAPTVVQLSWQENDPSAAGFRVVRAAKGHAFTTIATINSAATQTFTDNKVIPGITYTYTVLAFAGKKSSALSAPVKATAPLVAPTAVTATVITQTKVKLAWTNNDTKATGYTILRSGDGKKFATLTTLTGYATHEFNDTTVVSGHPYFYQVQATGAAGISSAASTAASASTPLTAPTGLSASIGSGGVVNLSWIGNDSNAGGYMILRSSGGKAYASVGTVSGAGTVTFTDKTAASFTAFSYQVEAVSGSIASTPTTAANASTPMAAPTALAVTANAPASVTIAWKANEPQATGYYVLRSSDNGQSFTKIATLTGPKTASYSDTTVASASSYVYEVKAYIGDTTSDASNTTAATPPLAAPSGLASVANNTATVALTWTDNDSHATGYVVLRSTDGGKTFATLTTLTDAGAHTFTDSTGASGHTYQYEVKATAGGVISPFSNVAISSTPLVAPSGAAATVVSGGVQISWTSNDANTAGYIILRAGATGDFKSVGTTTTATTFKDTTAVSFTTYRYRVQATAGASFSPATDAVTVATPLAAASALVVASSTPTAVNLTWKINEPQAIGYYVLRSTDGGASYTTLATLANSKTASYSDATVASASTYKYEVQAFNGDSTSAVSNSVSVTPPLAAASGLSATVNSTTSVALAWTDNGSHATGYTVSRSTDGGKTFGTLATLTDANANSYTDSSGASGHTYSYEIRATAGSVISPISNVVVASTPLVSPSGVTATLTSQGVQIAWTANDTNAAGYVILRATGSGDFAAIGSVTSGTGYLDKTAASFTTYSYRVKAVAGASASPLTDAATISTPMAAPTALTIASATSTSINLTWKANEPQATGYYVLRSSNGTDFTTIATLTGATVSTYSNTGLTTDTGFYYRVQAYHADTTSTVSNSVTTTTPLAMPTVLTATAGGPNSVSLSWTDNDSNATGYSVLRSTDGKTFGVVANLTSGSASSYTDTTVFSLTTYYYSIRATAANSVTSANSTGAVVTTLPGAPTTVTATASSPTLVSVGWKGTDASAGGYLVFRSSNGSDFAQVGKVVGAKTVSFSDSTVVSGHTYIYAIKAYGGPGGLISSAQSTGATATTPLAAPVSLVSTVAGTNVTLNWTDKDTNATGYDVLRSTDGTTFNVLTNIVSGTASSYTDTTSAAGQSYTYEVRATADGATSAVSNKAEVTVPTGSSGGVTITNRYANELVITATGGSDTVSISQSGQTLTIIADGQTFTNTAPGFGIYVYARGGTDSFTIDNTVSARTTVESIDGAATTIAATGSNVSVWSDAGDSITGSAVVHRITSFAGGVTKAIGAALANPTDSGATTKATLSLWGSGPVMSDVNQGSVGDCYFLSSLAAFAGQKNAALREKVVDMGDGTYAVQFEDNSGHDTFVRVSNDMPSGYFGGYAYAHPGANNTMWAMVMEKAFAYFRTGANTYNSINSGWMGSVYANLGVNSNLLWLSSVTSESSLYDMLNTNLTAGEPITFGTSSSPPNLVGGHAYTLVSVSKDGNGTTHYIVRNPWGVKGDALEDSGGYATLTFAQMKANFVDGAIATS